MWLIVSLETCMLFQNLSLVNVWKCMLLFWQHTLGENLYFWCKDVYFLEQLVCHVTHVVQSFAWIRVEMEVTGRNGSKRAVCYINRFEIVLHLFFSQLLMPKGCTYTIKQQKFTVELLLIKWRCSKKR